MKCWFRAYTRPNLNRMVFCCIYKTQRALTCEWHYQCISSTAHHYTRTNSRQHTYTQTHTNGQRTRCVATCATCWFLCVLQLISLLGPKMFLCKCIGERTPPVLRLYTASFKTVTSIQLHSNVNQVWSARL